MLRCGSRFAIPDCPDAMNLLRRRLLGGTSAAVILPLLGGGLLRPTAVLAAEWQKAAFTATSTADALKAQVSGPIAESRDIQITAPEIAENGAKVSVEIACSIANARTLSVFADRNPMPLCATLDFTPPALPYARLELKLAESTRLRALIKTTDGKNYVAFREVKVTLGGCGG